MIRIARLFVALTPFALAACAAPMATSNAGAPVTVKILAINDFHGNLEPPKQSVDAGFAVERVRVPIGGAAYLADAVARYRAKNPNSLVVSAGDLIGGSPITSSLFLDEPTIGVMNRIGLDFNAVGNHEFDRGRRELLRMQNGGCEELAAREPCQVERPFTGAKFKFLAANVLTETGEPLFPGTAIRRFGKGDRQVSVGLIGLTLEDTPSLVTPSGLAGLAFSDEAEAINRLVPELKRQGADAIVVLIHQGLYTTVGHNDASCGGVTGPLLPILARLDPRVDLVVSGHTHWAYVCDYAAIDPSRPFLVTSGGFRGAYLTDIDLTIDPATDRVIARRADNVIVQSEAYAGAQMRIEPSDRLERFNPDPGIAEYVARYAAAVRDYAQRVVGRLGGPTRKPALAIDETQLGNLIADAQLAATRSQGAQIALMNNTGIREDLVPGPDGAVTFGAIYAVQPFANDLVVKSFTGAQLRALLAQQFDGQSFDQAFSVSEGFSYAFDLSRPIGSRISDIRFDGQPIADDAVYRVTMNSFLASGGDSFTVFRDGTDAVVGGLDLEAMEAWIAAQPVRHLPPLGRVRNITPR